MILNVVNYTSCYIYTWSAGSCNMDVNWWEHGPHGSKMSTRNLCFLSSLSLSLAPADLLADEKKNHCHQISVKKLAFAIMLLHDEWYAPKMQWLLSTNVSCSWIAAPLRFLKITKETGNRGRPLFEAVGVQSSRGWKMVSFPSCKDYLSRAACFFENYEPSLSFKCQNVFFWWFNVWFDEVAELRPSGSDLPGRSSVEFLFREPWVSLVL